MRKKFNKQTNAQQKFLNFIFKVTLKPRKSTVVLKPAPGKVAPRKSKVILKPATKKVVITYKNKRSENISPKQSKSKNDVHEFSNIIITSSRGIHCYFKKSHALLLHNLISFYFVILSNVLISILF